MKDSKIIEICEMYNKELKRYHLLDHVRWMLQQIPLFLKEGRKEKKRQIDG